MLNFKLFYVKWIKRRCPHFCCLCTHKSWCFENGKKNVYLELKGDY